MKGERWTLATRTPLEIFWSQDEAQDVSFLRCFASGKQRGLCGSDKKTGAEISELISKVSWVHDTVANRKTFT